MNLRRRLTLLITGAVLAIFGGVVWWIHVSVEASIARHEAELKIIFDDVPNRIRTRPPLAEPEEPGNAWDLLRPSFDALWAMTPHEGNLPDLVFDPRGNSPEELRMLKRAEPWLEGCRRSTRRTRLEWRGPRDRDLPGKAARVVRALYSQAFLSWKAGRDPDALEWLTVGMTVAQDTANLGQSWTWDDFEREEDSAIKIAETMLGGYGWTPPQLQEFERRLDLLRSTRPPPALFFQFQSALVRNTVLNSHMNLMALDSYPSQYLDETLGWRDLYWRRLQVSRVLTGTRNIYLDAGALPWTSTTDPAARVLEIRDPYRKADVARLFIADGTPVEVLVESCQQLDMLRIAVAVARAQSVLGRPPRTAEEAGISSEFGRQCRIEVPDPASSAVKIVRGDLSWTLQRRQRE